MRDRGLHDGLRDFGLEVAALLSWEVKHGAEVPFIVEERGEDPILYRYSPLTAEFIALRWSTLHELPSYALAATALMSRAGAYLRLRGLPGTDPEPALRDFLERLYDESTRFEFPEERFEELYAELEDILAQDRLRATVVAPIHGVTIQSRRVELEDGLALLRASELSALPEALLAPEETAPQDRARPAVLCTYEADLSSDAPLPLAEARAQFRQLLSGLRLAGAGDAAFSPIAWARAGEGAWHPVPIPFSGDHRDRSWRLTREDEGELRELLEVIARSSHKGPVTWALDRFETGCAHMRGAPALTDHLLGLRALLADDRQDTGMPLRVAALCGPPGERTGVQRRLELAIARERSVIEGEVGPEAEADRALVQEIEQHLRALLRDVLCGYLEPDLRAAADDILLAADGRSATAREEISARDLRVSTSEQGAAESEIAVTPSADWGFDEDAASYSAPV